MPHSNYVQNIREFHRTFGMALDQRNPTQEEIQLRKNLMDEEDKEVTEALEVFRLDPNSMNYRALGKELIDKLVVTFGTLEALGFPTDVLWTRVHNSNMSKAGPDGIVQFREDGKLLKGPHYRPPSFEDILE